MCAMIPILRTRSSAMRVAVVLISPLPAVVGEGLVGLGHPVHVVFALEGPTLLVERVEDLAGQLLVHALLAPVARELHDPADRERAGTALRHLDRHLVVGTADAARPDLEHRRHGLDRLLEHLDGRLAAPLGDEGERIVDELLGDGLLAIEHHPVDQLLHEPGAVDGVRLDHAWGDLCATRHQVPRFAPYLERPWRRSATPEVSSPPRITLYRKPGRSLTRPPRISTTECSWRLCPSPGMYAPTSMPFVSRTRATFRSAEFGFFGVVV